MAEKPSTTKEIEKNPAPMSKEDDRKVSKVESDSVKKEEPKIQKNAKEIKDDSEKKSADAKSKFSQSREYLKSVQDELQNKKKEINDESKKMREMYSESGESSVTLWEKKELQKPLDHKEKVEKEVTRNLQEKHSLEIEKEIIHMDLESAEPGTKKALHFVTLKAQVDIDKVSDTSKKNALKGLKSPDGNIIDVEKIDLKNLSEKQKETIKIYQTQQYMKEMVVLAGKPGQTPKELQEELIKNAQDKFGTIFTDQKDKIELLTEKSFIEQAKKNPLILKDFIDDVKTDGMMVSGIDPESKIGKSLVAVTQGNIDAYKELFPEEKNIKRMADVFGGSYVDIIGDVPLDQVTDKRKNIFKGLENYSESLTSTREDMKNQRFREGILREDFLDKDGKPDEKAFQNAVDIAAKASTGLTARHIESIANKVSNSELHPFLKFLADIFAGIGASLEASGLLKGTFWTDYLNQNKDKNNTDSSLGSGEGGGGSFEQIAEVGAGDFINAAKFYLGPPPRPYEMGGKGRKDVPGDPIDCSQLVVNSLVDTGCIPAGSDTTAMGFASMSQKIGDMEGKEGDFLIKPDPEPHIAIITANLGGGKYKTIESASGKGGVVETERQAGSSFSVYRNPFLDGNGGIRRGRMGSDIAGMKDIMGSHGAKPEYIGGVEGAANEIKRNQARYERVARMTGVPWELIGAIHFRESSFSFEKALHNGDKIIGTGQKTYRVPAGRGPFATWEESAIDALRMKGGLGFTSINGSDDQLRRVAAYAERYNGYGYRNRGGVSPYVWSGTDKYKGGMYVADHVYNPNKKDPRPGVMPIIMSVLKKSGVTEPPLAQNETTTTVNDDAIAESNELSPDAEKYGKIASTFDSFVQRRVGYTFGSRDISKGLDCMTSVEEAIRGAYPEEFMKLIGDARVESINLGRQPESRQDLTTNDNKNDRDTGDQVVDELGTRGSQTLYVRGVDRHQQISNWLKRGEGAYMSRGGSHVMFVYKEPSGNIVVYRCDGTQNGKNNPGCVKATLENELGKGSHYYRMAKLDFSKISPPKATPEKESPQKGPSTQESSPKVEEVFKSVGLTEQMMDAFIQKIEKSEYNGDQRNIVQWNSKETFPSLGIGHFIWLQAGSKEKFQESFPEMIQYLQSHGATLPASCANLDIRNGSCPWNTVEDMKKFPGLQALKDFLGTPANKRLQFMFIFEKRLVPFLDSSSGQKLKQLISSDPARVPYAVIDYINFKGEGLNPDKDVEIVGGQKVQWGLKQVLDGMKEPFNLASFKDSAKRVLQSRDPKIVDPNRAGWFSRIDAY